MKTFKNAVTNNGQRCDLVHVNVDNFDDIPDNLVSKVHAVCIKENMMLIVNHPQWNIWGLPGGTREMGETKEQTLAREIQEEANCKMLDCRPISYQKIISPNGDVNYYLQYLSNVQPLGKFQSDPAGNINQILWIEPCNYRNYIEKKEFKEIVIQRAIELLSATKK